MAVAYKMKFEGATLEQYDQVMQLMGLTGETEPPEGAIFHWAAPTENGIIVVDVWESDEQYNHFAETQIGPYTQQVGIPAPPVVTRYDVHNTLVGDAAVNHPGSFARTIA
jgi:hypothetical protein